MINSVKKQVKPSLSGEEKTELARCEHIIDEGLKTFVEVGKALEIIRAAALYRLTHSNFDSYVKDRFKITHHRAYELIRHAKVSQGLPEEKLNEAQAKAAGKVEEGKRKGVVSRARKNAAAKGKRMTAQDIHNASGVHKAYTVNEFSKELGGLVNKAKHEGISLLQITDTIGAVHGQLVKMCRDAQKVTGPKSA
jgi:phosphotransacetylase